jgi:hypothetical protein
VPSRMSEPCRTLCQATGMNKIRDLSRSVGVSINIITPLRCHMTEGSCGRGVVNDQ